MSKRFLFCYISSHQPDFILFPWRDFLDLDTLFQPLLLTFQFLLVFLRVFLSLPMILNTIILIQISFQAAQIKLFFPENLITWALCVEDWL